MAAAYVQVTATQEDQDNAAAGWPLTVDTAPSIGNRLFLIVCNEDATPPGPVTDTAGNTWSKLADLDTTGGAHNSTIWTAHLAGVPTTITVTKGAAGERPTVAGCIEVSGVEPVNANVLATAAVTNSGTGTACSTGTSGTPSQADCIAIAVWDNNDGKALSAQTNGYTEVVDLGTTGGGGGTPHVAIAYLVLSSATTQECTATRAAGAGVNWSAGIFVLKGAGGAAAASLPPVPPYRQSSAVFSR
jgi:hypothetical protein